MAFTRGQDFVGGVPAACFPAGSCLGATFDPASAVKVGKALASECRSKSAWALLGPTVNIHRSPLGGRNFESYSEDPVLSGLMASGYIKGLQGEGITAVIKHFVSVFSLRRGFAGQVLIENHHLETRRSATTPRRTDVVST